MLSSFLRRRCSGITYSSGSSGFWVNFWNWRHVLGLHLLLGLVLSIVYHLLFFSLLSSILDVRVLVTAVELHAYPAIAGGRLPASCESVNVWTYA